MFDMNCVNVRIGNILKNDIKQNNKYGYNILNQSLYIVALFFYVIYGIGLHSHLLKKR